MEDDLADTPAYRPCVRWKVIDPVRQELYDDEIVAEAAMIIGHNVGLPP